MNKEFNMYIVKVLKRKDAASIIVAIWIAMALSQSLYAPVFQLSYRISQLGTTNDSNGFGGLNQGLRMEYLNPLVGLLLQLIVIELLIRLFVWVHPMLVRKQK